MCNSWHWNVAGVALIQKGYSIVCAERGRWSVAYTPRCTGVRHLDCSALMKRIKVGCSGLKCPFNASFVAILAVIFCACVPIKVSAEMLYSWSQIVADSNLSVRVVVSADDSCPLLEVDGVGVNMDVRALPDEGVFDDIVCEKVLPPSYKIRTIRAAGRKFPDLHIKNGREKLKVAVLGDTGCRVSSTIQQDCKSEDGWVLGKVLRGVASHNADIVIHVGDYLYREVSCGDESKCDVDVFGDNAKTWAADWLALMQLISEKHVFVFARGNHEDCKRSYRGWFRYLDAYSISEKGAACENVLPSWVLDFAKWNMGNVAIYVYDSSAINDAYMGCRKCTRKFKSRFLKVVDGSKDNVRTRILVTHRPLWSHLDKIGGSAHRGSMLQVDMLGKVLAQNFDGIISGHVHLGEMLYAYVANGKNTKNFSASGEVEPKLFQIISGNGGALLEKEILSSGNEIFLSEQGSLIGVMGTLREYGFCVIDFLEEQGPNKMLATFYGVNGDGGERKRFFIQ